jgi:putative ABC transport system permease protein
MRLFFPRRDSGYLDGDLREIYTDIYEEKGRMAADCWYWAQFLRTVPPLIIHSFHWSLIMLKNYLKIALRNMNRQKSYSLINVIGLAIGIAAVILIMLFIVDEMSYDQFHVNKDRIFRLVRTTSVLSAAPIGPALMQEFPEIQDVVRIDPTGRTLVHDPGTNKSFYEDHIAWVDANVFRLFSFKLVRGNPETVLQEPNTMVITTSIAKKYFGDTNPMGKVLDGENLEFRITGVMEEAPENSHYHPGIFLSFKTLEGLTNRLENWKTNWLYTYLLLKNKDSASKIESQLPSFFEKHVGNAWTIFHLQPLLDVHLRSNLAWDIEPQGSIVYVNIFSAIAILLLIIACINFMNLATARSTRRSKEVGLRKVLGANRPQLMRQFLGESFLTAILAFMIAIVLVVLSLPAFNELASKNLNLDLFSAKIFPGFLAITIFVGLFAGSYPALLLSKFSPINAMKNQVQFFTRKYGSVSLRRLLVIIQFAISIILIIGTTVIYKQLAFVKNKNLGFSKDQIIVVPFEGGNFDERYSVIKNELIQDPNIVHVSASGDIPGQGPSDFYYRPEGLAEDMEKLPVWDTYFVDYDFIETLGMEMVKGRNFDEKHSSDATAFILNETAVKNAIEQSGADWENPIGKHLDFYTPGKKGWSVYKSGQVVGVVKDFNYLSLHQPIGPLVLQVLPGAFDYLLVKIRTQDIGGSLSFIKNKVTEFAPGKPFEYSFLDEQFDSLYRSEQRLGKVFGIFAFLAIMVACMGLFGLTAFTADQRTKEIGIRKVLGASLSNIITLISREFVRLVLVADIVSLPISYYFMHRWLKNFVYRIDIGMWMFVFASVIALLIALFTVSAQAIRAALANPVDSLRYE